MAGIDYGNPVTRIRARENSLLDQGRINRMLEAKEEDDLVKILSETDYGPYLKDFQGADQYEEMLSLEQHRVYQFIGEICPKTDFLKLITLPHDLQNLKVTLKSRQSKNLEMMNRLGLLPLSSLKETLTLEGWKEITSSLGEPLPSLGDRILQEREPQKIDILLDRARFERTHHLLKRIGSRLLKEFFFNYGDLLNIEIFVRTKTMGQGVDFLEESLLPIGYLDSSLFLEAFREPLSYLLDRLKMTPYAQVVEEGLRFWQEKEDLSVYEKLRDNFLMDRIRKAKFIFFGPEAIFGYLYAKETEIKILRILFIGKTNRLPHKVIRERLRDLYV